MNAIYSIRKQLGITQSALAEGIGVTQGNVSHYENGRQLVPPDVAGKLIRYAASRGLAVSYDQIYQPHLADAPTEEGEAA